MKLSHLDQAGRARMVDVGDKPMMERTAELIPLCHPLGLDHVEVEASLADSLPGVRVWARVRTVGRTGVEMEALTAVAVALLTVYDMVKAVDGNLVIGDVQLIEKQKAPVEA